MKAEVDKLDINELVNVLTSLNNLKTKVDDLNAGKSKNVPIIVLKKLSDVIANEVVENTKFNTLNTIAITLENKFSMH